MHDEQIVSLYWDRNETAIRETETKYDRYGLWHLFHPRYLFY